VLIYLFDLVTARKIQEMTFGFFWDVTLCSVVVAEQYAVLVRRIQEWTGSKIFSFFLFFILHLWMMQK